MFCNARCSSTYAFKLINITYKRTVASVALKRNNKEDLVIRCKRKEYNYYMGQRYSKLDDVPLASKGWTHNKSKGDYFYVYPQSPLSEGDRFQLSDLHLQDSVTQRLQKDGIETLTSFQNEAFGTICKGHHSILTAESGCGKTLAYLLPIIHNIIGEKSSSMNSPRALILVPGRELAHQIASVAEKLVGETNLKVKVVVGGRTKRAMLNPEFSEVDILIGTPGALGKLTGVGIYKLNQLSYAVFDEADTLIDDSFIERLSSIVKRVGTSQIILVSATMPTNIPSILQPYNNSFVNVTSPFLHRPLNHLTQQFLRLGRSIKPQQLLQIIKKNRDPLLIFTNRNETCNWVSYFLKENGVSASRVNGDMNYEERIVQWNEFQSQNNRILVATDLCSRGLHLPHVKHVVNYDFPLYVADYLHRIGRTGRFGQESCKVTNFVAGDEEVKIVQKIELAIRRNEAIQNVDGNITRILQRKLLRKSTNEDSFM
ncbi:probable ATP-dependent RNA helicase DDX28 isoform X1 [Photinus pyralis]|uniref:probable ATP-dependent RNA helicase DDX28 isoform X1 n=1 Tax=Photinus pyralis TaxID=7054 RepID=UPI0012670328|nr:probable ATP-dependent RNA helicase DDX28 isoform X1 [Photinus pyralis]